MVRGLDSGERAHGLKSQQRPSAFSSFFLSLYLSLTHTNACCHVLKLFLLVMGAAKSEGSLKSHSSAICEVNTDLRAYVIILHLATGLSGG